ncbi:hypothetical protein XENTR_v10022957 [Xenopus tropicalis]|nr:hypothetical protein XENTR_v10022957 [Xenopus tropicalis]
MIPPSAQRGHLVANWSYSYSVSGTYSQQWVGCTSTFLFNNSPRVSETRGTVPPETGSRAQGIYPPLGFSAAL